MLVGKREFIQHTSKYLKLAEVEKVIITHRGKPGLSLGAFPRGKRASALRGRIKIHMDEKEINTPVLEEFPC